MHSGSVACLAVGVDAPFTVATPGAEPVSARTALIPARLRHQLVAGGDRMVFCYLDPASSRAKACRAQMARQDARGIGFDHVAEARLIRLDDPEQWLRQAAPTAPAPIDDRIREAARLLLASPGSEVSAQMLAVRCGLSVSRFQHLFSAQTGTSFRRYRLWARMLRAADLISQGHDLTTIAAEAGFSSPSHATSTFHAMFGLPPSRLLDLPLIVTRPDGHHGGS
ncbi:AraC family transcriptional regulator [Actinocorallia sp. B10E7]|uniref:helix-turn-helix transcriptional regulator n=1 Tax=Actinocorallia sp. B10E7 TaxID=3153558 RepID=UPI00325DAE32